MNTKIGFIPPLPWEGEGNGPSQYRTGGIPGPQVSIFPDARFCSRLLKMLRNDNGVRTYVIHFDDIFVPLQHNAWYRHISSADESRRNTPYQPTQHSNYKWWNERKTYLWIYIFHTKCVLVKHPKITLAYWPLLVTLDLCIVQIFFWQQCKVLSLKANDFVWVNLYSPFIHFIHAMY